LSLTNNKLISNLFDMFSKSYMNLVLKKPGLILLLMSLLIVFFAYHTQSFRLDASADSLVLENDEALSYYRSIRARYGSDDFLIITYTPDGELFSDAVLSELHSLSESLTKLSRVKSVISLLDVPLIQSPPVTLSELREEILTLESSKIDKKLARNEFLSSPLYRNLIISPDGKTTALQIYLQHDETWHQLQQQRNALLEQQLGNELSAGQSAELSALTQEFSAYSTQFQAQQNSDIRAIRHIMADYQGKAELHLGGVPMIASDSIDFIRYDLKTFGLGVLGFFVLILFVVFRKLRWITLPMLTCFSAGVITIGILGLIDWPVTVVSSNFISLLLIITLSLTVHLIVRYRELHALSADTGQYQLVAETLRSKFVPCFYTAITTIVAFSSLIFSGIRPIIDFGWMMSIGVSVAFILVFTLFPASLMFLQAGSVSNQNDWTDKITRFFAVFIKAYGKGVLSFVLVLILLSIMGISTLTVENRFIDYFKESTEIYRGMELIDRKLGGTTPLDVIIDAPAEFFEEEEDDWSPFEDDFPPGFKQHSSITADSYWFNTFQLKKVAELHQYLQSLPETGKVLSVNTTMQLLAQIDPEVIADDFLLALFYKKLPEDIKQLLLKPYLSDDGNQLRFSIRVFESDRSLQRDALLTKIHEQLTTAFGLKPEQVHLTGMLVLYNNMLQSLFRSQILTIGVVFVAILVMFIIVFCNIKMALIALIPNVFSAALVLGLMGWLKIPLDMMTITIAAISIGIAVDDTIHYVHRFTDEFNQDNNYWAAIERSHASIGRAMYYTSITITLGFSILALSNFVPSIYFGLLTGFAMVIALLADLTLLPLLISLFKPLR